jgi:hypothetical protein
MTFNALYCEDGRARSRSGLFQFVIDVLNVPGASVFGDDELIVI